jgi:glycine/D-amino acid oxidase-like deaminating enzyme
LAEAEEVRRITGCEGYAAAIVDSSGGALDPVAYAHGLAATLSPQSVQVFRESAVLSVRREGSQWSLKTSEGVLLAKKVVLCANGGNPGLHPALAKTVLPLPVYQVATKPLPLAMRRSILPEGHAMTDTSTNVFSIRFDSEGRLITAAPASAPLGRSALSDRINQRLGSMIPAYTATELDYAWRGTAWLNGNLLPRIVAVDEGLFAIQACNGRGLALTTIIGREMARLLTSAAGYEPLAPLEKPQPVPGYSVARYVPGLMMLGASLERKARHTAARVIGRSTL